MLKQIYDSYAPVRTSIGSPNNWNYLIDVTSNNKLFLLGHVSLLSGASSKAQIFTFRASFWQTHHSIHYWDILLFCWTDHRWDVDFLYGIQEQNSQEAFSQSLCKTVIDKPCIDNYNRDSAVSLLIQGPPPDKYKRCTLNDGSCSTEDLRKNSYLSTSQTRPLCRVCGEWEIVHFFLARV